MSGTAIAQALPILISPVISRLYTPDNFGALALYMSIAAIISVISTARYELAVMLPEKKDDALNVVALSVTIALLVSGLTFILVVLLKNKAITFFEEPRIGPWLFLLPIVVLFSGLFQTLNYWSTRNKTFKRNAATRISQSTVASGSQLGLGLLNTGSSGLIIGYIAGIIVRPIILGLDILKNYKSYKKVVNKAGMWKVARRYRNFLRINTPHAFLGSLQDNGILYVIMYFFEKVVLGSYSFAFRIIKAPTELIGSSVYQVFYQKATEAFQAGRDLRPMILKIYRNLFLIGLPFFVMLFIFAPPLFAFVFGEEWRVAGQIASIITPWIFLNFLAAPVSSMAIIMNRQKEAMYITLADIVLRLVSIIIGGIYGDYRLSFLLLSISCSSLLIFALIWYYRIGNPANKSTYA
jgi:O-antigen/teichoic acid export membrane protein